MLAYKLEMLFPSLTMLLSYSGQECFFADEARFPLAFKSLILVGNRLIFYYDRPRPAVFGQSSFKIKTAEPDLFFYMKLSKKRKGLIPFRGRVWAIHPQRAGSGR